MKFLFAILFSSMVLFTACEDDTDDDLPLDGDELCDNGMMDGDETGIDCDADTATTCPPCAFCADSLLSSIYNVDDQSGSYELDIDCGTPECGPCKQELVVQSIGADGEEMPFRDQYSYNKILSAAGQDTLELNHLSYPGLKVEKIPAGFGGPGHLIVTANQGVMTADSGLFIRTIIMYIPNPENMVSDNPYFGPGVVTDMVDSEPLDPGACVANPISQELPYIIYQEKLDDYPNMLHRCFFSYVDGGLNSELSIDYLLGYLQSEYYVKGGINQGSLLYEPNPLPGVVDVLGEFTGLTFKIQYPFIL